MANDPSISVAARAPPLDAKKKIPLWGWIVGGIMAFILGVLLLCVALPFVIGLAYMSNATQEPKRQPPKPPERLPAIEPAWKG